jgi:hypothetical protein
MKVKALIFSALGSVALVLAVAANTAGQKPADESESFSADRWEYLVVAGSMSNLTPSGEPSLRKERNAGFSREAFVLEQNMDKLGAKGWELVSVSGSPADPILYFKRRK